MSAVLVEGSNVTSTVLPVEGTAHSDRVEQGHHAPGPCAGRAPQQRAIEAVGRHGHGKELVRRRPRRQRVVDTTLVTTRERLIAGP